MISLSQRRYGSRVSRQGRSRRCLSYQRRRARRKADRRLAETAELTRDGALVVLDAASRVSTGMADTMLIFYWVTLCAMTTHPFFCCCHTVIMCRGAEGSGCEPEVPFPAAAFPAATLKVPFRVMV